MVQAWEQLQTRLVGLSELYQHIL